MRKLLVRFAVVSVLAAGFLLVPLLRSHARAAGASGEAPRATAAEQTDLNVTVYNSNIALVRDVRELRLPTGDFALRFEDVAAAINPATVHLRSLSEPDKLSVVEQNYEYDLLDPAKLLQKYVGREVTLVRQVKESGTTRWEEVKATLLADTNGPVWKIGNEIVTGMSADSYRFPELPENLYSQPTLLWLLENKGATAQKVEASYLTGGLNWVADYVLTVGRDEKAADLDGWVTLSNQSGTAYKNARLQLVAGELHRVTPPGALNLEGAVMSRTAPAAPQFQQEAFSEYHLYSLERRTSIQNNESKQISLLSATSVPVAKAYIVEGQQGYFQSDYTSGNPVSQSVKVVYRFRNDQASNLGMPLPAGTIRVYQSDSRGGVQFAGEDQIKHTPKDENLEIQIGNAFDIVAERKQTDYRRVGKDTYEMEFEITLRNHKDAPVTVEVREPIGGDWSILSATHKYTKLDAFTAGFTVPVDKNGKATLDYRVRVKY